MDSTNSFETRFECLTGNAPFCWQRRLFNDYFAKGAIPSALDIPTGLGKTSVMTLWYLARKAGAALPRRLAYVVDRRAVVDQATTVADKIRSKDSELRVSTLRGQHVDNREWLADPAKSAIVVGTVDMIGSRLLFSGYGVSRKMRPYHAGLLGADTLVVLDEAHLVPPFEKLLRTVEGEADMLGPRTEEDRKIVPRFRLLSLSATGRNDAADKKSRVFRLLPEDRQDKGVEERLSARKQLTVKKIDDRKNLVAELVDPAWRLGTEQGSVRVLVYCDSREDAVKVKNEIAKKCKKEKYQSACELLVGGRRVFERETLFNWLTEHEFLGDAKDVPEQPSFLIATSAGEVGVDLDADHMVCDLVEWERMVQRLGRVNRRGKGDACIEVIAAPDTNKPKTKVGEWEKRWNECLARLRKPLDRLRCIGSGDERDASPGAILELKERAEKDSELQEAIEEATTQAPLRPALTRALVDAWSMTSLDKHTGRPDDIQPWLRGWEEKQRPQTTIIWREHLPVRADGSVITPKEIETFFEAAPPHTSEKLEIETFTVVEWLVEHTKHLSISKKTDESDVPLKQKDVIAYVLSLAGDYRRTLKGTDLADSSDNKKNLERKKKLHGELHGATLVVDARFGGLTEDGMLDEKADGLLRVIDDGKEWLPRLKDNEPAVRFQVRVVTAEDNAESAGDWRERFRFEEKRTEEGEATRWILVEKWRHDAETGDDRSVGRRQELAEHHAWTEGKARTLAKAIGLSDSYVDMLAAAARLHDEGKRHRLWQRAANAPLGEKIYAKTDRRMNIRLLDGYRHEFGSLPWAEKNQSFKSLPDDLRDLALHLVAAHHGWARPIIPTNGCDAPPSVLEKRACDVALRFARLQKQWGPWGLAWWEALLRAADQQASRDNDQVGRRIGESV